MRIRIQIVKALLFMMLSIGVSAQCDRVSDSLALVAIYNSCVGDGWTNKTNWLQPGKPISTWFGVRLNPSGCVESLSMPTNKMNGALPDETGNLTSLKLLNLSNNNLSGNLPVSIGKLTVCEEMNLSSNKLNGPVHASFGNLTRLKKLYLNLNQFSGNLPSALGGMKEITVLHLNQNSLNGPLPSTLANLSNLEELLISQNMFIGTIPSSFGNLSRLRTFILSQNKMSGALPASLGSLAKLQFFYADENQFSGSVPTEWSGMTSLKELWLHRNALSGVIPQGLTSIVSLQKLLLNQNQFFGSIPDQIGNLKNLISLHLSDNQFSGPIPPSIGNLTSLLSFLADKNQLSGALPAELGNCTNLVQLNLSYNFLSGELPYSLGRLINLKRLYLQNNRLKGCFPDSFERFCALGESTNISANGYSFRFNPPLLFQGDFGRWCNGEGRAKAVATANSPLCEGSDLVLTGQGGKLYVWTGPNGFQSTAASSVLSAIGPQQFGTYVLAVENEYMCRDTTKVTVAPTATVSADVIGKICEGDTIRLTASGGVTYRWTGPAGFISLLQNPILLNATPAMEGTYTVEINTGDCIIQKRIPVEFVKTGTLQSNSQVCEGETVEISVSDGTEFVWSGPGNFSATSQKVTIPGISVNGAGVYSVVVKNAVGCRFTLTDTIKVQALKIPSLASFPPVCEGRDTLWLPGNVEGISGSWSGNNVAIQEDEYYFTAAGIRQDIKLTYTPSPSQGCVGPAGIVVTVVAVSILTLDTIPSTDELDTNGSADITISANVKPLVATLSGPRTVVEEFRNSDTIRLVDLPSGEYTLTVADGSGCADSLQFSIRYVRPFVSFPNVVLTSSRSGNDRFFMQGKNTGSYSLDIYNRWGNLVFSGQNLEAGESEQGWRPSSGEAGVYIWRATIQTYFGVQQMAGAVTVL